MEAKKNRKKCNKAIFPFLFLLFCFIVYHIPKTYEKSYTIEKINVKESYNLKKQQFSYIFQYKDYDYVYGVKAKPYAKRKLVKDIEILEYENTTCIKPWGLLSFPYLCSQNNEPIYFEDVPLEMKEKMNIEQKENVNQNFENISYTIPYEEDNIAVWNYKDILLFSKEHVTKLNLFSKDVYEMPLVGKTQNYLVIPDYNEEYYFQKVYIIDVEKQKKIEWNLDEKLSFDSFVLGNIKNKLYLIDQKEKIEWELDIAHKKMQKIGTTNGRFYEKGWQEKSIVKMINEHQTFSFETPIVYFNEEEKIAFSYFEQKTKTNFKVDTMIEQKKDRLYYLENGVLNVFDPFLGKTWVMEYSEWNFHDYHMIFIF